VSKKISLETKLDQCLRQDRISFKLSPEESWQEIERRIGSAKVIEMKSSARPNFWRIAVAASIALIASTGLLYVMNSNEFATSHATAQVELPDGSKVTLNAQSRASFNSLAWFIEREVEHLEGEAFFEVEEGSKFTVNTPNGSVAVLGTSFNVNIKDDVLIVGCKTGKVEVHDLAESQKVILTPGMQVAISETEQITQSLDIDSIDAWVKGEYSFQNIAVQEVFEIISTRSGYSIELPSELEMSYTGQFSMEQPLKEILKTVCKPLNLNFKIDEEGKDILITKK
jgi:ferric-dicitrate binding protein FerR (iron transport regulator)